jgi:hypothetical protein
VGAVVAGGTVVDGDALAVVVGPTLRRRAPHADARAARPAIAPRRMRRRRPRRPSSGPAPVPGSAGPRPVAPVPETIAPK